MRWNQATPATMAENAHQMNIITPVAALWDTQDRTVSNVRPTLTTALVTLVRIAPSVLIESILMHVPVWKTMRAAPVS